MLPGVKGHLLSGAFVESHLPAASTDAERVRRELVAWRNALRHAWPGLDPAKHSPVRGGAALRRARIRRA